MMNKYDYRIGYIMGAVFGSVLTLGFTNHNQPDTQKDLNDVDKQRIALEYIISKNGCNPRLCDVSMDADRSK